LDAELPVRVYKKLRNYAFGIYAYRKGMPVPVIRKTDKINGQNVGNAAQNERAAKKVRP
jgi:hypothetical protein